MNQTANEILNENLQKSFNKIMKDLSDSKEPKSTNESKEPKGLITFV